MMKKSRYKFSERRDEVVKMYRVITLFNCHYLIDVPMSLVGFPNRSSKDGFVFMGFKKPTTNAKTISTMCDFDHAAISLHQTLFALLTLFIRIYIFLFFIKFAA